MIPIPKFSEGDLVRVTSYDLTTGVSAGFIGSVEARSLMHDLNGDYYVYLIDFGGLIGTQYLSEHLLEKVDEESQVVKQDMVNSPDHYTHGGIETIDFIRAKLTEEEFRGYIKGNVIKYMARAGKKGELDEDMAKALKYLEIYFHK